MGKILKLEAPARKADTAQSIFAVQQMMVERLFGVSLDEMLDKDYVIRTPMSASFALTDVRQVFKAEAIPAEVKQSVMKTSSGTQPFLLNEAAAAYFGGAGGVFAPSTYAEVLEGVALASLIPKLWGLQPFKDNDLAGHVIYFAKPDPFKGDSTPTFARTAEGRAGGDIGFEVRRTNFDAQRYITHLPYSYELAKVLQGRIGLEAKISQIFAEARIYRDEYWAFMKWYEALTAGTLEGAAFGLYTDGAIADVDGQPHDYVGWYKLSNGEIRAGDAESFAGSSSVSTGSDLFDLILYVIETMGGTKPTSSLAGRSYKHQWAPEYVVVPQKVANALIRDFKNGNLQTVWVNRNDVPLYKDETHYLARLTLGNKGVDLWVMPDEIANRLGRTSADSPAKTIYPCFFGRYFGMGVTAPASPLLLMVDDGFEVLSVDGVNQLRRNNTKVHTMFELKTELLLNAAQSFLVKVIES